MLNLYYGIQGPSLTKNQKKKRQIKGEMMINRALFLLVAAFLTQSCMSRPPNPPNIPFEVVNKTQSDIKVAYAISSLFAQKEERFAVDINEVIPRGVTYRTWINYSGFDDVLIGDIVFKVFCGGGKEILLDGSRLKRKVADLHREMGATYYIENCSGHKDD